MKCAMIHRSRRESSTTTRRSSRGETARIPGRYAIKKYTFLSHVLRVERVNNRDGYVTHRIVVIGLVAHKRFGADEERAIIYNIYSTGASFVTFVDRIAG